MTKELDIGNISSKFKTGIPENYLSKVVNYAQNKKNIYRIQK